jgi:hypothetical protein
MNIQMNGLEVCTLTYTPATLVLKAYNSQQSSLKGRVPENKPNQMSDVYSVTIIMRRSDFR